MNKGVQDQLIGTAIGGAAKIGLSMIPGVGGIISQAASPLIDSLITSKVQDAANARNYNELSNATTMTNNPYMRNGGTIPVTKIWSKYGGEEGRENLRKRLQDGGYISNDDKVNPQAIERLQQDLANQGYDIGSVDGVAGNKTLSALMSMDEVSQQAMQQEQATQQPNQEQMDLSQYSDEQLQQALQQLQEQGDEESQGMMQMIMQELQSRQGQQQEQPMMKYGGAIVGMPDLAKYVGNSHAQGGILVDSKGIPTTESNAVAEVEGGEYKVDLGDETYIFSKRLTI